MRNEGERPLLIVVGASAGGVEALTELVAELPAGLRAAVAVVLHVAPSGSSVLPAILNRAGQLSVRSARDGDAIEAGCVYVAPPDCHLVVEDGRLALLHGPRENGHRPAIDPLFATAAEAYGPRTIGVVLTGTLDDGSSGLAAIKLRGGVAVVQDPEDAMFSGMPASAIARVAVDHVVPLSALAATLVRLVEGGPPVTDPPRDPPPQSDTPGPELDAAPAMPAGAAAGLGCPECGGALWYVDDGASQRFRCRIGHAYSEQSLLQEQGRSLEIALWTALRALQERAGLMRRMARRARDADNPKSADRFDEQAGELDERAAVIRDHIVPAAIESGPEAATG
jgi:two-component system, chemotaxis family, protein-glutamate methylesterase/glutaminase